MLAPRRVAGATIVAVVALALTATTSAETAQAKATVSMSGSTSIAPLARALAKKYVAKYRKRARFKLLEGGSDVGIRDVSRGRVTIGNASRDPQSGDPGGLVFNKIARDGVCIVTHPSNKLRNLSQEQVQAIFSGSVNNWADVPGAQVSGPIDLFVRTAASGTQDAFQNIFMGDSRVASSATERTSNGLVQSSVRSNDQAIGFVDFNFAEGTNRVGYKGVACNLRNAKSEQYRGTRNFWMVTRGKARGASKKFISWVRSRAGQRIVGTRWVRVR